MTSYYENNAHLYLHRYDFFFWVGGDYAELKKRSSSLDTFSKHYRSINSSSRVEEKLYILLALRQLLLQNVTDFILLASTYKGGWPILSIAVSSFH